jgi:hypothetical protein
MNIKKPQGLTNIAFASLCGVSKQAIGKAVKEGRLNRANGLIDLQDPLNHRYLLEKQAASKGLEILPDNDDFEAGCEQKSNKNLQAAIPPPGSSYENGSLIMKADMEIRVLIQREKEMKIKNAQTLGDLISKHQMIGILGQIGQSVKNNFVDLPRREAEIMAAKLGIPDKSRKLERLWSEYNHKAIENVKAEVDRLQRDEIYE